MCGRFVVAWFLSFAASSYALAPQPSYTRRSVTVTGLVGALGGFAFVDVPDAHASGVSLEEAAKNAEKYRVKPTCTPTNPEYCSAQYEKMLDPRLRLSKEELAKRDERNDKERESLRAMLNKST